MKDLKAAVAKNINALRVSAKMSQSALGEVLNYSDKAVSKWERAESVPDVFVLKEIADYFGVSVDYLLSESHEERNDAPTSAAERRNRFIITLLAASLVWLIATFIFVMMQITSPTSVFPNWLVYIYSIPACSVVLLVFNAIWGRRRRNFVFITTLIWSILLSVYLSFLKIAPFDYLWLVFILGAPAQVIIFLWAGLHVPKLPGGKTSPKPVPENDVVEPKAEDVRD